MTDDEAVGFLLDLVSIPSVSGEEPQAVKFLIEALAKHGLNSEIDVVGNGIGRTPIGNSRLMFLGHIDTVSGWIEPRVADGQVFGRGAVDAKGPLAAAAVAAIRARDTRGLEVVAAVGEEGSSIGTRHLANGKGPDALIIGEPGGSDSIVLGYKGSMRATISFNHPVSHSAGREPTVVDTAVDAWLRVRSVCRELSPGETVFDQLSPALLEFRSHTDGLRQRADLVASFRLPPHLDIAHAKCRIQEAVVPGRVVYGQADPAFRSGRDNGLVSSLLRSIRKEDIRPRFKVKTGTSDMNVVAPIWRSPTVAYGPGDSSLDHTPHEHIAIDEYLRGIRVLTRVFQEWGNA